MSGHVRNRGALCSHGDAAREDLLAVLDGALAAIEPERLIAETVERDGRRIVVDGRVYDLDAIDDAYVIGAGKGASELVAALAEELGDALAGGVAVDKDGQARDVEGIDVREAAHPVPDERSREAGERVHDLSRSVTEDDVVFACITGGASSLLVRPVEGVSLADAADVTDRLLRAGAPIEAVNAVRKHVSSIKGGRLAEAIHPARTVTLVVVDEVGGRPWGPTVPDGSTYGDALEALERYTSNAPASIERHLRAGRSEPERETPDAEAFERLRTQTVVLADATDACEGAAERAVDLGYESAILSAEIEGESREVGRCLAGIAREVRYRERPFEPPCILVSGGETTVTVDGEGSRGGPNQEFATAFAREIEGLEGITVLAVDTDGTDGPTSIAGGLVDASTARRAADQSIDLADALDRHATSDALSALDDAVLTRPGTNVMDLRLICVDEDEG